MIKSLKANYAQVSFVLLAFSIMVIIGCIAVGNTVQNGVLSTVTVALNESEKTIRAYLREPKIAFDNIYVAVIGMLDRGESQEAVSDYITQTTESLQAQEDGVLGFIGVYGYIRDEFLDSVDFKYDDDYIPQQRPWYQLAIRNTKAEYTAPYVDAYTGNVIMSISRELYGVESDYYGVLALDVDITWMMEYAQSLQFVAGGYGMIVNQYIYTIAHPVEELRNVPLHELGDGYAEISDLLRKDHEVSAKRIQDINGSDVIVYFHRLYNGWYIGVVMPVGSYYADLYMAAFALIIPGSILMIALNCILLRLSAAKRRSEEKNLAKSSFLARMSHEIRTPMNAILGMIELILRKNLPPDARAEAIDIKHASNNLLSIVNDILDFSKIESNRMELVSANYYLASLLNDTINIIRMRIAETQLSFIINIDETLPGVLYGDEVRLRQVLLNLLSNAVKYTREGSVSLVVKGEIGNNDTVMLTFEISDTGIGIKHEDIKNLFGDFAQFDMRKNAGVEGTGLGLAIARSLCRLMGGDITVTSTYGEGSVFTARMPQKIVNHAPLEAWENEKRNEVSDGVKFIAPEARLLIVDDIATNLKVAEGLLAPYEALVDCCKSAPEAIALLRKRNYDIIFMDHMMPEMDGVEATGIIRSMNLPHIPIIALTANAVSGMREMFLKNGFDDYLAKPIEVSKLNEIMEMWIPSKKQLKADSNGKTPMTRTTVFNIEGLDAKRGISQIGGSEEGYIEVLELFCEDVAARTDILRETVETDKLSQFVINVHALKGALASIGATRLSESAAFLERAGRDGNIDVIVEKLEIFLKELSTLTDCIKQLSLQHPRST